jgi:predicted nicotinamide N-methyase
VAIAARLAGAATAVAADTDRMALAAVRLNAVANGVELETTAEDLLARGPGRWGVILAGDLFYERELASRVTAFIEAAAKGGAPVLVGDPRRSYFPEGRFTHLAEYRVPVTRDLEDAEIKRTAVWRV